jgi:hypothetical protein
MRDPEIPSPPSPRPPHRHYEEANRGVRLSSPPCVKLKLAPRGGGGGGLATHLPGLGVVPSKRQREFLHHAVQKRIVTQQCHTRRRTSAGPTRPALSLPCENRFKHNTNLPPSERCDAPECKPRSRSCSPGSRLAQWSCRLHPGVDLREERGAGSWGKPWRDTSSSTASNSRFSCRPRRVPG